MTHFIVDINLMDQEAWREHLAILEALPPSEKRDLDIEYARIFADPPEPAPEMPQEADAGPEASDTP